MEVTHLTVDGSITPDGFLHVDSRINLPPGPSPGDDDRETGLSQPVGEDTWSVLQAIWAERKEPRAVARTKEEIDAEIDEMRNDDEARMQEIERLTGGKPIGKESSDIDGLCRHQCGGYLIEQPATFGARAAAYFSARFRRRGSRRGAGELVRMECRVESLTTSDTAILAEYESFFESSKVDVLPITAPICDRASAIRAIPISFDGRLLAPRRGSREPRRALLDQRFAVERRFFSRLPVVLP